MATKAQMFPSKHLSAEDLNGKPFTLNIESANTEAVGEVEKTVLKFKGAKKTLPLNLTNWIAIAEITGEDDSADWVGHAIELYPTTTGFKGETVACIRIRAPAQRELPKAKAPAPKPTVADDLDDEIPF